MRLANHAIWSYNSHYVDPAIDRDRCAPWQLAFWRDRTKEADFLLHRAGHFRLADAKWTEHPEGPGKLALVRREMDPSPVSAIVCRSANRYPIAEDIEALPLADLPALLQDRFP